MGIHHRISVAHRTQKEHLLGPAKMEQGEQQGQMLGFGKARNSRRSKNQPLGVEKDSTQRIPEENIKINTITDQGRLEPPLTWRSECSTAMTAFLDWCCLSKMDTWHATLLFHRGHVLARGSGIQIFLPAKM